MLYPVERLLQSRGQVVCVTHQETVRDALTKMVANDFSQLPVIDSQGRLTGIISEQSITRTYFHISEQVNLFDLPVNHCQDKPVTLTPDEEIFVALDRLQSVNAVVIVNDKKPMGILTYYDATHFFRELTAGLILVEDIETTLRQYIEAVCDTEAIMKAALVSAFGISRRDTSSPAKLYEEMSFFDHVLFITTEKNWPRFEAYFEPKKLFQSMMEPVREIRNQLMHFRDEVSNIQYDALQRSREWLVSRPKPQAPKNLTVVESVTPQKVTVNESDTETQAVTGKYRPLFAWLREQGDGNRNVQVTFSQVEEILGEPLPPTARTHQSWWANDSVGHRQSQAWLRAGWRVSEYDLSAETVTFQRTNKVLYQVYFSDLLSALKERRPGLTQATRTYTESWWNFGAGRSGFSLGWAFDARGNFRTELYMAIREKAQNKQAFDWLHKRKDTIEADLGFPLGWQRLDDSIASRIYVQRPGAITDPPEKLEEISSWALDTLIAMADVFRPLIRELPLD